MADLQQSSFANIQMPVTNPGMTLGALRPPEVQGLLQTVPIASLVENGLASGIAAGSDIAKMPTAGKELQDRNQQLATDMMMQQQAQKFLRSPQGQNNVPNTTSIGPGGQISRAPVQVNPWTIAGGLTNPMGGSVNNFGTATGTPPSAPTASGTITTPEAPPQGDTPPYTPADVKDWYQTYKGTNAQDVEWNAQSGRYDVTLKDGRVQPVHPGFIQTHLGNWKPPSMDQDMANGAQGAPSAQVGGMPQTAGDAVNQGVAQGIAQNNIARSQGGNQPPSAPAAPQQASQNGAQPATSQPPSAPGAPLQPPPTPASQGYGHVSPIDPDPDRFFKQTGTTPDMMGQLAQNPNQPNPILKPVPGGENWSGDPAVISPAGVKIFTNRQTGRMYMLDGPGDLMNEQRLYMGDSQPVTQPKPASEPVNKQINEMIAKVGLGDGNTMTPIQREEAYRTAAAMENQKPVPSEAQDRMDFTREALQRSSDLQQTVSKMKPDQRAAGYVGMSKLSDLYGSSVPGPVKDVLKNIGVTDALKKMGLNPQYDPQVGQMMQQYAALRDVFAEDRYKSRITDPERQSLLEEIGNPVQESFPDRLNFFARTVAQSLDKQVDFGLAQRWGLPASAVSDANRYKNPGALADNPIPVSSQAEYNKVPKGQWYLDSSNKPTLKQ